MDRVLFPFGPNAQGNHKHNSGAQGSQGFYPSPKVIRGITPTALSLNLIHKFYITLVDNLRDKNLSLIMGSNTRIRQ